MKQIFRLLIF